MSRFTKQITSYWQQFRTVVRNEYGSIFTDAGVILVLVLALLIYSTLYSLAYGTQVLRNVPIGVIDMSNTSTSRQLINTFNAGPNVYVAYEPGDMDEAKHLSTTGRYTAWFTSPPITRKNCSADSRRSFRSMSMPAIF